MYKIYKRIATF